MASFKNYKVWLDGQIVDSDKAVIPIFTQTALRGANVYEGLRAYWDEKRQDMFIWMLDQHVDRLFRDMKVMRMQSPFSKDDLKQGIRDWITANEFREDVHFRLFVYLGDGGPWGVRAFRPDEITCGAFIFGSPRPHVDALTKGVNVAVSSWRRINDDSVPPRVKAGANYQNSRLAIIEARTNGYDDAIILNRDGKVSEFTGACMMIVKDGVLMAPPVSEGTLDSITRKCLLELYEMEYGKPPLVTRIDRTELYMAQEMLMCGTAEEVTPVVSVDRIPVGDGEVGEVTRKLQTLYLDAVRGRDQRFVQRRAPCYAR
jgi:branched-chain amino acid aminotransferase